MALVNLTSIYTSKRWNLDTTTGRKIFIINCSKFTLVRFLHNYLIVLFISLGFSQQIIPQITETYDNVNVKNITYHKKSRTGIEKVKYEKYYKYGQKESEETYKNGKLDGLWTEWHANGQKRWERTYKDDKPDGKWIDWHTNGKIV